MHLVKRVVSDWFFYLDDLSSVKLNDSDWYNVTPTVPQCGHTQLNTQSSNSSKCLMTLDFLDFIFRVDDVSEISIFWGIFLIGISLWIEDSVLCRQVSYISLSQLLGWFGLGFLDSFSS